MSILGFWISIRPIKMEKKTYITSPNFLHLAMAEKSFKFLFYTEPNTDFKIDIQGHTRWTLNWPKLISKKYFLWETVKFNNLWWLQRYHTNKNMWTIAVWRIEITSSLATVIIRQHQLSSACLWFLVLYMTNIPFKTKSQHAQLNSPSSS